MMEKLTLIALLMVSVSGLVCAGDTVTFRATDDAYVDSLNTTASTGGESTLSVQGLFDPDINALLSIPIDSVQRTFLKFDISSIAAGSTIDSAYFGIYLNDSFQVAANCSLELYYISNDAWNESDINWDNSQAMADSGELIRLPQPVDTNRYYEWNLLSGLGNNLDVTADYAVDGIITVMLTTQFEGLNNSAEFYSDENGSLQPYLTIGYTQVPEPCSLTLAMLGAGTVLSLRRKK